MSTPMTEPISFYPKPWEPFDSGLSSTTGIPIGQRPSKPRDYNRDMAGCPHEWSFIGREYANEISADGASVRVSVDEFFCRRCLEYREVKR